ncbi:MAG: hypothetical protein JW827_12800 [Spirochaetes bacterium]|nr:hypothetical protein [Spirochaetota bacterium]
MKQKKELSNFREVLSKYMHLSGIKIAVFLEDGRKIHLHNAVLKKDKILNNYYEDLNGNAIPFSKIEYAELYSDN